MLTPNICEFRIQTTIPNLSLVGEVLVDSIAIAIVAFATEISLAQMFSEKHGYKIDADQVCISYSNSKQATRDKLQ